MIITIILLIDETNSRRTFAKIRGRVKTRKVSKVEHFIKIYDK